MYDWNRRVFDQSIRMETNKIDIQNFDMHFFLTDKRQFPDGQQRMKGLSISVLSKFLY